MIHKHKKIIVYIFLGALLGIVIFGQLRVNSQVAFYNSPQSTNISAREVLTFAESNQSLEQAYQDLISQDNNYKSNLNDKNKLESDVNDEINRLEIINGKNKITGPGVNISLDGKFTTADLVDLLNAVKNISYEAMAINDIRFGGEMGVSVDEKNVIIQGKRTDHSLEVKIIGDGDVLKTSLERSGGIFEQLKTNPDIKISAEKSDNITLSPIE